MFCDSVVGMHITADTLLIRNAKRDPSCFASLYEKYVSRVFRYFWYRTGRNRALADDLAQETFLRAFNDLRRYKDRGYSYAAYLLKIAHNLLVDEYRKPISAPLAEAHDVPYEIRHDLERRSEEDALWRAVRTLPQKSRDIVLMKYQQHLRSREIADVLGITENAVRLDLSRVRKKLAAHRFLRGVRPPAPPRRPGGKRRASRR